MVAVVGQERTGAVLGVIVRASVLIGAVLMLIGLALGGIVAGLILVAGLGVLILVLQVLVVLLPLVAARTVGLSLRGGCARADRRQNGQ